MLLAKETFGGLGRKASRFLSELGNITESHGHVHKGAIVRIVRPESRCALCRGDGAMCLQSKFSVVQAVARLFIPSRNCQVDESGEV